MKKAGIFWCLMVYSQKKLGVLVYDAGFGGWNTSFVTAGPMIEGGTAL